MNKVVSIGAGHQIIKDIKHDSFAKQKMFVVDDLGILLKKSTMEQEVDAFLFCEDLIFNAETKALKDYYLAKSRQNFSVSQKVFSSIASKENSAGMISIIKKQELCFDKELANKTSFILVNDGIEIPGNMGTIFRTCDAVDCDLVINTNIRTSVYNPKVIHASRGTVLKVPFVNANVEQTAKFLLDNGYTILTCETLDGISFEKANYKGKIAIIVGSERYGIDKKWFEYPHKNIYIPMFGEMTSLNVGVAGSILLYQAKMNR